MGYWVSSRVLIGSAYQHGHTIRTWQLFALPFQVTFKPATVVYIERKISHCSGFTEASLCITGQSLAR